MVKDRDLGLISLDSSPPCASFWLFVAFHILYLTVYSSFLSQEYPQEIKQKWTLNLGLLFQIYDKKIDPLRALRPVNMPKTSSEQTGDKTTEQEVLVKWQFRKLREDKPRWKKF